MLSTYTVDAISFEGDPTSFVVGTVTLIPDDSNLTSFGHTITIPTSTTGGQIQMDGSSTTLPISIDGTATPLPGPKTAPTTVTGTGGTNTGTNTGANTGTGTGTDSGTFTGSGGFSHIICRNERTFWASLGCLAHHSLEQYIHSDLGRIQYHFSNYYRSDSVGAIDPIVPGCIFGRGPTGKGGGGMEVVVFLVGLIVEVE